MVITRIITTRIIFRSCKGKDKVVVVWGCTTNKVVHFDHTASRGSGLDASYAFQAAPEWELAESADNHGRRNNLKDAVEDRSTGPEKTGGAGEE